MRVIGVALAYALAVRLAWALPVRAGLIAVWPAAGIALGLALRGGVRLWPGVLLGAFAAKLPACGLVAALGGAIAPTVEVVICTLVIDRWIRPMLGRPALARLTGIIALHVGALASALIGQSALTLADQRHGPFLDAVLRWTLGDVAGMLLIAPLIVAAGRRLPPLRPLVVARRPPPAAAAPAARRRGRAHGRRAAHRGVADLQRAPRPDLAHDP